MAVLNTPEKIRLALSELRISPKDGKVSGKEAARILTWRAKYEQDVDHEYKIGTVNKHSEKLGVTPAHARKNLYDVNAVFDLEIEPKRGNQKAKRKLA